MTNLPPIPYTITKVMRVIVSAIGYARNPIFHVPALHNSYKDFFRELYSLRNKLIWYR